MDNNVWSYTEILPNRSSIVSLLHLTSTYMASKTEKKRSSRLAM